MPDNNDNLPSKLFTQMLSETLTNESYSLKC
jgi:hypothetical protein